MTDAEAPGLKKFTFGPTALATPANAVTIARLLAAPLFVAMILAWGATWFNVVVGLIVAGSDGLDGQPTANGDTFDHHEHTAASRVIPLGSKAKVTNLKTGESTTVTITDRGPLARGRKIDLSKDAARDIGLTKKEGVTRVKIVVTKPPRPNP